MTRNLKALGLALMAAFAMSAIAASAASASTQGELTVPEPATLIGTEQGSVEENRLTSFGGFVQCPDSTYTGYEYDATPHEPVPSGGVTTVTLEPDYKEANENCRGSSGSYATVDMNGCDYVLHLGGTTGAKVGTYGVTADVVCPDENEITVTVWFTENQHTNEPNNPRCVLHVPEQKDLEGFHATDNGDGTIDVAGTAEGITVNQTRLSFLCPSGTHEENGKFDLNTRVTGENALEEEVPVSLSHETAP